MNMKITTNKTKTTHKPYLPTDELKDNWIYVDAEGDLVLTDWLRNPVIVLQSDNIFGSTSIQWPLHDTDVSTITIKR